MHLQQAPQFSQSINLTIEEGILFFTGYFVPYEAAAARAFFFAFNWRRATASCAPEVGMRGAWVEFHKIAFSSGGEGGSSFFALGQLSEWLNFALWGLE